MKIGFGIFCSTSDNKLSTNHKIKLVNFNRENLFKVFTRNLDDFIKLLELSKDMGFTIFRLGSNFIPFASHPKFKQEWFTEIGNILIDRSQLVKNFKIRITMHPGQYVVLNSFNPNVRSKSLRELEYHFKVLDFLDLGSESIVVIHLGGVYGDKRRALKNLYNVFEDNKWLLKRIALENDERYYTVQEVLEVAESFSVPVVYDHYHHKLNPSNFDVDRLLSTWRNRTPETHISSPPSYPHKFGEHGDYVKAEDFVEMISMFPDSIDIDVIPEVKKKEIAIAKLAKELQEKYPQIAKQLVLSSKVFSLL